MVVVSVVVVSCVLQPQKADTVITMIPIKVIAFFIPLYFTGKCAPKKANLRWGRCDTQSCGARSRDPATKPLSNFLGIPLLPLGLTRSGTSN